jgi:GT2 family glycosyltransferase
MKKERLRHKLPGPLGGWLRRLVVWLVGLGIRVVGDLLNTAVGNGLDPKKLWPKELEQVEWPWAGWDEIKRIKLEQGKLAPWGAHDFLLLFNALGEGARAGGLLNSSPQASIIIPVFNKAEYTFQCLRSLMREVDLSEHEIIVIDDASTDETAQLLSHLKTILKVVSNRSNQGFVKSCNEGAAAARGRHLVFLNNDTVVQPGWLKNLLETVDDDETVGAVGSMLVYPDGRLQEAGGIIWRDGTGWNYGRGEDTGDGRFKYAREVDYCSGASLLVRRELFERVGGFDERYTPAYYEDTDLCFRIRSMGFKVMYQPASRLIHYEGVTTGTDERGGVKRYQEINRQRFVEKWREVLLAGHLESDPRSVEKAARRLCGTGVIVFDEMFNSPQHDSGSLRLTLILKLLAEWSRPLFVTTYHLSEETENLLGKMGVEVLRLPAYKNLSACEEIIRKGDFKLAILSRPDLADALLPLIRKCCPGIKIIYDTVDVHFLRLQREYKLTGDESIRREALMRQEQEARLALMCDQAWCVTPVDKEILEQEAPGARIEVIPNIHSLHGRGKEFEERRGLLFIGNFNHKPNGDAVRYFVREVLPIIRESLPVIEFRIVGSNLPPEIAALGSEAVTVLGYVPDVSDLFQGARVMVAPLRYGAGMKGKVGQALAYGLPTVTTSIGAEGMGIMHGREALIADDAESFARAVVELYTDRALWQRVADNGYELIRSNYSPEVVREKIIAAASELIELKRSLARLPEEKVPTAV